MRTGEPTAQFPSFTMAPPSKLRSACDACHQAKVRCTGGVSCLHCRNHNQECHYSYAARIGKPKGSRNRKTLARLQCALSLDGRAELGTNMVGSIVSGTDDGVPDENNSFGWNPLLAAPPWVDGEDPALQSYPVVDTAKTYKTCQLPLQSDTASYSWVWPPPPLPLSPPESVGNYNTTHVSASPGEAVSPPQVKTQAPISQTVHVNSGNISDMYNPAGNPTWLSAPTSPNDTMAPVQDSRNRCDCLEQQTSKLVCLHNITTSVSPARPDSFDNRLQGVTSILLACQKTLRCHICDKDPSLILFTVASLQMAFRQLEIFLVGPIDLLSASSCAASPDDTRLAGGGGGSSSYYPLTHEGGGFHHLKHILLRRAVSGAQDILQDLHSVIMTTVTQPEVQVQTHHPSSGIFQYEATDSSYLRLAVDRLQAGLNMLDGVLDRRFSGSV
jgi:hypothetical protein